MRAIVLAMALAVPLAPAAAGIVLMVEDAAAPWSAPDGSGYANDLVRAAYAAVGEKVELQVVPYARCKHFVMRGMAAGCFSMSAAPELHGLVKFADAPLFRVFPRFYFNAAQAHAIGKESDFKPGMRIGVVNGYEYPDSVRALAQRGVVLEESRSESTNLKKLALGRLDAVLLMTDALKTDAVLLREAEVDNVVFGFALAPMGSYLGFSGQRADGELARSLFNRGYALISANGVKRAIAAKWQVRVEP
ncbi:MAG: transporter substrate-binding domain-containing protein [Pseudomonadota bacterium]